MEDASVSRWAKTGVGWTGTGWIVLFVAVGHHAGAIRSPSARAGQPF